MKAHGLVTTGRLDDVGRPFEAVVEDGASALLSRTPDSPLAGPALGLVTRTEYDALGTWTTTTGISAQLPGGPVPAGTWASSVSVLQSGAGLLASAQAAAQQLPSSGATRARRAEILARLARVQGRTIAARADIEENLVDLLAASRRAGDISGGGQQVRSQLSHLLRYWEARWYVY